MDFNRAAAMAAVLNVNSRQCPTHRTVHPVVSSSVLLDPIAARPI
ncbi:MAG TPA: hypothetical protein VF336_04875 [Syntrophales bacterium]